MKAHEFDYTGVIPAVELVFFSNKTRYQKELNYALTSKNDLCTRVALTELLVSTVTDDIIASVRENAVVDVDADGVKEAVCSLLLSNGLDDPRVSAEAIASKVPTYARLSSGRQTAACN